MEDWVADDAKRGRRREEEEERKEGR